MKMLYFRLLGAFGNETVNTTVCDPSTTYAENAAILSMTHIKNRAMGLLFGTKLHFCINETLPTFPTEFSLETTCLLHTARKEQNGTVGNIFNCFEYPLLRKYSYEMFTGEKLFIFYQKIRAFF